MKTLSVTLKDLQIFLKDRGAVVMLFLLPFVFIIALALMGRNVDLSGGNNTEETRLPLTVVNNDPQGEATQSLLDGLAGTGTVELVKGEAAETEELLTKSTLRYALFIPSGFSSDLAAGRPASLRLVVHPLVNESELMTVELVLNRVVREYLMMDYLDQGLQQMGAMQAANPDAAITFNMERIRQQVDLQKAQAALRPLVQVVETTPAAETPVEEMNLPGLGEVTVLGMAVLFVFLGAQNTAMSIFKEKRIGSFRRLMTAPISKAGLLVGKLLPNLLISLVQIAVIFITGSYFLRLVGLEPLNLGGDLLGLVVVSLATAICAVSLGLLIVSIAKTEGQVGGLSSVLLFVAGILSGSFIPLFLFPQALENVARLMPQYWANQAFFGMVFRGQTLLDFWPNVLVLLAFSLAFFGVGLWRFKFE
jgi:ABC-2 type transport system permease protein